MKINDEWEYDPQVQYLRRIFARIESAWSQSNQKGIHINEDEFEELYLHGLARLCQLKGIKIPKATLPLNENLEKLIKEV